MRRREFITLIGMTAATWPRAAPAQQPGALVRVGFLTPRSQPTASAPDAFSDAFVAGMSSLGYSEGKNLVIAWRYANGDYAQLARFANELVDMNPRVIVTYGTAAARVLQKATSTIPIVVAAAVDLVGAGIVASLAHPGGNLTGISVIDVDISAKQLELLKSLSPKLSRLAVLLNPGNPANPLVLKRVETNASSLSIEIVPVNATTPQAIETAFAEASQRGASAVIVAADAFFSGQGSQIAASAARHQLATISLYKDHVLAGCLMSYGQNVAEFHRRAATYVDKILKGTKAEDLPVEQPTRFELVINAKTAKNLGLTVPQTILATADEVIE